VHQHQSQPNEAQVGRGKSQPWDNLCAGDGKCEETLVPGLQRQQSLLQGSKANGKHRVSFPDLRSDRRWSRTLFDGVQLPHPLHAASTGEGIPPGFEHHRERLPRPVGRAQVDGCRRAVAVPRAGHPCQGQRRGNVSGGRERRAPDNWARGKLGLQGAGGSGAVANGGEGQHGGQLLPDDAGGDDGSRGSSALAEQRARQARGSSAGRAVQLVRPEVGRDHPLRVHPVRRGDGHGDPADDLLGNGQLVEAN